MTARDIDVAIVLTYAHDGCETSESKTYFVPGGATLLSYEIAVRMADGSMPRIVAMTFEGSSILARYNDEALAQSFRDGRRFERRRLRRRLRKVLGL